MFEVSTYALLTYCIDTVPIHKLKLFDDIFGFVGWYFAVYRSLCLLMCVTPTLLSLFIYITHIIQTYLQLSLYSDKVFLHLVEKRILELSIGLYSVLLSNR